MDYKLLFGLKSNAIFTPKTLRTLAMDALIDIDTIGELMPNFEQLKPEYKPTIDEYPKYHRFQTSFFALRLSPVPIIKKWLPPTLYREYFIRYISESVLNWESYRRDVLQCFIEDFQYFDFSDLTFEQAILIKYYPFNLYECSDQTLLVTWVYFYISDSKSMCFKCINKYKIQNMTLINDVSVLESTALVKMFKNDWCDYCGVQPLFQFLPFDREDASETPILKSTTHFNLKPSLKRSHSSSQQ